MNVSNISDRCWRARWIRWRNALLSSPRFQRLAARSPLLRPIARARARALFDLVAGFVYSQVLSACIETGLLDLLATGPLPREDIAARTDLPLAAVETLLRAAATLDLVEPLGARWALGAAGAALRGNRGIAEMVAHHALLYADLADPVALLRRGGGGGALARHWRYAEAAGSGDAGQVAGYSALMAASQPLVAQQVIDAYRFKAHRRLLDVGGGDGAFLSAVGARAPALERALFDLPAVADRARRLSVALGGTRPLQTFGGDFLADPLPTGYDVITLVRVLHDHDDASALRLLRAIRAALPPGGKLVIAEPMAATPGAARSGDGYFGLYLLAMGSGRPRRPDEIAEMLRQAGFARSRLVSTAMPLTVRVIAASAD